MKNFLLVTSSEKYNTSFRPYYSTSTQMKTKGIIVHFFKWVKVPIRYLKNLQQFRAQFSIGSKVTELGFELLPII